MLVTFAAQTYSRLTHHLQLVPRAFHRLKGLKVETV